MSMLHKARGKGRYRRESGQDDLGEEVGLTVTGAARHVDSFETATATVMKVLCLRAARVIVHSHKELARSGFLLPPPSPGQCEL